MIQSFGKITVAVAGTPSRATTNQTDTTKKVPLQSILIQALPANTGLIYVMCKEGSSPGDARTTLAQCIAILPAPSSATTGAFPAASFSIPNAVQGLDLSHFWIDVSVSGEGALVVGTHSNGMPFE